MSLQRSDAHHRALLVADDFGLSAGINDAVIALAGTGRLSGTSVLVTAPHVNDAVRVLADQADDLALGLHLNLTEGLACDSVATVTSGRAFRGLGHIIKQSLLRQLDVAAVTAEFQRQLDWFRSATGRWPDMVDGHQHVHAIPQVRLATISVTSAPDWPAPPLVRVPSGRAAGSRTTLATAAKAGTIAWLSGGFGEALKSAGLPHNATFAGVADLGDADAASEDLDRAIGHGNTSRHLAMCHPATGGDDKIAARRTAEFNALQTIDDLPDRIWHPQRSANGTIDWERWT